MKLSDYLLILLGASLMLVSCTPERTSTTKHVKKDVWGDDEVFGLGKDESGNPVMKSDKRSSFENKSSDIASGRDFSGSDYANKSYRKKRWGGDSKYKTKQFKSNTTTGQYKHEPWYVRKQAAGANQKATASNKKFSVNPFRSKSKSVKGSKHMTTSSDARVDNRRNKYSQPDIIHWRDQQGSSGPSVKDTNNLLGR